MATGTTTKPFINESPNVFTDISSEEYREYNFGKNGFLKIIRPQLLSVSASGGHRLFDESGQSHYIPAGWIGITWKAREGQPNFVK